MKKLGRVFLALFLLANIFELSAQDIPVLQPTLLHSNTYTYAQQIKWEKYLAKIEKGSQDESELFDEEKQMKKLYYDAKGPITSVGEGKWYCGGGLDKITASSILSSQRKYNFEVDNIHDFNVFTAWAPSDKKNPIGEKINFHFKSKWSAPGAKFNKIFVWNGYIRNTELWKQYSRVAKFKLHANNRPIAILQLQDVDNTQVFSIKPIGPEVKKDLVLTFEIMEIYQGSFFSDVIVSEINFDCLDVL